MSTKPKRTSYSGFKCTVCDKTFRTAKILDAHLVHTHQLLTSAGPESPPSDPLKIEKPIIHRQQCYKCNGNIHPDKQHLCGDLTIRPVAAGLYTVERTKTKVVKSYQCGCGWTFRAWRDFQSHILLQHRKHMHGFFFPDHKHFWWWKEDVFKETGQRYYTQSPGKGDQIPTEACTEYVVQDAVEGGCQYWHCLHKPELDSRQCPSAILVTRFENGLFVTFYSEHVGFPHGPYNIPTAFQRFRLGNTRTWLELPEEGIDEGKDRLIFKLRGLLGYTIDHVGALSGKRLRALYGRALDLVRLVNDGVPSLVAQPTVPQQRTRPINTVVGERVHRGPALDVTSTIKEQRVGDEHFSVISTDAACGDKDTLKIGKVFSLKQVATKRPPNGRHCPAPDGSKSTAGEQMLEAPTRPNTRSKDVGAQSNPKKVSTKKGLSEMDIEEELLSEVVKPKPPKETAGDGLKNPAPSSLTKFSYADTFKDFVETQFGKHDTKSLNKRGRSDASHENRVVITEQSVVPAKPVVITEQSVVPAKPVVITEQSVVPAKPVVPDKPYAKPMPKRRRTILTIAASPVTPEENTVVTTKPSVVEPPVVENKSYTKPGPKRRRNLQIEDTSPKIPKEHTVLTPEPAVEHNVVETKSYTRPGPKRRRNLQIEDTSTKIPKEDTIVTPEPVVEHPVVENKSYTKPGPKRRRKLQDTAVIPKESVTQSSPEASVHKAAVESEDTTSQTKRNSKSVELVVNSVRSKPSATVEDLQNKYQVKPVHSVTVSEIEEVIDTDVKSECDYDITIEENCVGNIKEYEVMEREDDCNILILRI